MPTRHVFIGFVATVLWASAASAESLLYVAYVSSDHATVRSGPGFKFYATGRLTWGTKVEVYSVIAGGWCAIRPPEGSFSWVDKSKLKSTDDPGLAEVIGDGEPSRIGTQYRDAHHVTQIRLKKGELVELLGSRQLAERSGEPVRIWCKISPPSGEFRFVRLQDISRQPPNDEAGPDGSISNWPPSTGTSEARQVEQSKTNVIRQPKSSLRVHVRDSAELPPKSPDDGQAPEDWDLLTHDTDSRETTPESTEPVPALSLLSNEIDVDSGDQAHCVEQIQFQARSRRSTICAGRTDASPTGQTGPWSIRDEAIGNAGVLWRSREVLAGNALVAIDAQLSLVVAQDPASWDLPRLKSQVEAVIDSTESPSLRNRARHLLAKISQFQDIKRRYDRMALFGYGPAGPGTSSDATAGRRRTTGSGVADDALTGRSDGLYDGTGWLMPVITQRSGIPQYALTDPSGRILQFVAPAPGVNLRRFERQEVGIRGSRGYIPRLKKPHITAERIVVLNRHRR